MAFYPPICGSAMEKDSNTSLCIDNGYVSHI